MVSFSVGDTVIYPSHGLGFVIDFQKNEILGQVVSLIVVEFQSDKMVLRLPEEKTVELGLRKLSSMDTMQHALDILRTRKAGKKVVWSRRVQECEEKIKSGDPLAIAEVVGDLSRRHGLTECSYSERRLYQFALTRLADELAAVYSINIDDAVCRIESCLHRVA